MGNRYNWGRAERALRKLPFVSFGNGDDLNTRYPEIVKMASPAAGAPLEMREVLWGGEVVGVIARTNGKGIYHELPSASMYDTEGDIPRLLRSGSVINEATHA